MFRSWKLVAAAAAAAVLTVAAPVAAQSAAGLYLLTTEVRVVGFQTTGSYCGGFRVNGNVVGLTCNKYITTPSVDTDNISTSTTVQLAAGDVVTVGVLPLMGGNGLTISGSHPTESNFTVTRLQ